MGATWLISDTHFGHENCCTRFKREDGSPLRPFKNAEEMNTEMIKRWNARVRPDDKVYHLGDVVINKKYLWIVSQLNGNKRLVRGNHDIFKTKEYIDAGFKEVYGVRVLEDMILSHIPLHPECITERFFHNVHGHLHANTLKDKRYINVSVEQIDYAPISIEEVRARF